NDWREIQPRRHRRENNCSDAEWHATVSDGEVGIQLSIPKRAASHLWARQAVGGKGSKFRDRMAEREARIVRGCQAKPGDYASGGEGNRGAGAGSVFTAF